MTWMTEDEARDGIAYAAEEARKTLPAAQVAAVDKMDLSDFDRDTVLSNIARTVGDEPEWIRRLIAQGVEEYGMTLGEDGIWRELLLYADDSPCTPGIAC